MTPELARKPSSAAAIIKRRLSEKARYWRCLRSRVLSPLAALALAAVNGHDTAAHPLDALSGEEITTAVAILQAAGDTNAATRFALIGLSEPDKDAVLAWRPEQPIARRAFVVARRERTVYEGVVNLGERRVERWRAIPGVQSGILASEWQSAQKITASDHGWQAAMRRRGYDPLDARVFCAPLSAGYLAEPQDKGHRLLKVTCFDTAGARNVWSRPIEGLVAVVDLDANRVLRLIDTGPVPIGRARGQSDDGSQPELHPTLKPVPDGRPAAPDVTVEGNMVRWINWSFHYRMDPRSGLVLSLVRYDDQGRPRMVLYRGSLAEMFVPYMDPDPGWSFRGYMDVGEYGIGPLSLPLAPGGDCPSDAWMLDATFADEYGKVITRQGVICLFERNTGAPLWRHAEIVNNSYEARPAVELVMRTIPSLGNYDYIIDWVLTEAGTIRIDVGITGIDQTKGVRARTMGDASAPLDTASGNLVAPNLVGVNHDHFLSFRLDVDIDGRANTLVRQRLVTQRLRGLAGRRSLWHVANKDVAVEGPIHADSPNGIELWRIVNSNRTNALGQHPGYELRADHTGISLLAADDLPQRRAGFSAAPLWVTAYNETELYAAGRYPNQSRGGDGLPAYVAQHRRVENADIVLWYTMGFHHVTRPEDWPVMPTIWHSVSLVPYGFFDHNPALDVPRNSSGAGGASAARPAPPP
jgi:primary-amine oxidase